MAARSSDMMNSDECKMSPVQWFGSSEVRSSLAAAHRKRDAVEELWCFTRLKHLVSGSQGNAVSNTGRPPLAECRAAAAEGLQGAV